MTSTKKLILEANEHLKSLAELMAKTYESMEVEIDPALIENSNLALGELMKCIKHLALIQGEITGHELMPPAPKCDSVNSDPGLISRDAIN